VTILLHVAGVVLAVGSYLAVAICIGAILHGNATPAPPDCDHYEWRKPW